MVIPKLIFALPYHALELILLLTDYDELLDGNSVFTDFHTK